jgi:hypothetical protein
VLSDHSILFAHLSTFIAIIKLERVQVGGQIPELLLSED